MSPIVICALPLYKFDRRSFWLSRNEEPQDTEGPHVYSPQPDPQGCVRAQRTFRVEDPIIHAHMILRRHIIPGASLIEFGLETVQKASQKPVIELRDMIIPNPGVVTDETEVTALIDMGPKRFSLKAQDLLLCEGNFAFERGKEQEPAPLLFSSVDMSYYRFNKPPLDISSLYDDFRRLGYQYGKGLHMIQQIWKAGSTYIIELDNQIKALNPWLLDGIFQSVYAVLYLGGRLNSLKEAQTLFLPFKIQSMTIHSPAKGKCYVCIHKGDLQENQTDLFARMHLYDEDWNALLWIDGLLFKRVSVGYLDAFDASLAGWHSDSTPSPIRKIDFPAPREQAGAVDEAQLQDRIQIDLKRMVAELLEVDEPDLDLAEPMKSYGFDSITLMEFARRINDMYQLHGGAEVTPALFFEHPTIVSLIRFISQEYRENLLTCYGNKVLTTKSRQPEGISTEKKNPLPRIEAYPSSEISRDPIAIIGMHAVLPGSEDPQSFFRHLINGDDLISEIPKDRWDWQACYGEAQTGKNRTPIKWGGFVRDMDKFDARFFNISPREAELMDPQQRVFLQTVWRCIEDAGYKPSDLAGTRTGLFVGISIDDYKDHLIRNRVPLAPQMATGCFFAMTANRISYLLGLNGTSEAIDTACSSSLVALHRAVETLYSGECELAIAGGVNALLTPTFFVTLSQAGMLSPDGKRKTFDKDANGYVRGEGVGAVFLKPLRKALADGDHIYTLIKGCAVNHGGTANSLTAPNAAAQARLIVRAHEKAGFDPSTVTYIEAHGTGTTLGDPVEINGLKRAFAELYQKWKRPLPDAPNCAIGSVKTFIGHLEPAAGISALVKTLLSMQHKTLPGNLNFKEKNPYIQLEGTPFYILDQTRPWVPQVDASGHQVPLRAGISSFGFGGTNAHVVLESFDQPPQPDHESDRPRLIVLSAQTEERLRAYAGNLAEFLSQGPPSPKVRTSVSPPSLSWLCAMASEILDVNELDIDPDEVLNEYGLDPIGFQALLNRINDRYGSHLSITDIPPDATLKEWSAIIPPLLSPSPMTDSQTDSFSPNEDLSLRDLAYTLQIGREPMPIRLATIVSSLPELKEQLYDFVKAPQPPPQKSPTGKWIDRPVFSP